MFIVFVCKKAIGEFDLLLVLRICLFVVLRKFRVIPSHEAMKRLVLRASVQYAKEPYMKDLLLRLLAYENIGVLRIIDRYRKKGYYVVLSTAAPAAYADLIAKHFCFDYVCATSMAVEQSDWHENVKEEKMRATVHLLDKIDARLAIFLTDHDDDLPLLRIPKDANIIVNPTSKTLEKLEQERIVYRLLPK